jgi:hypothetical protein
MIGGVGRGNSVASSSCDGNGHLIRSLASCRVCIHRGALRDARLDLASDPRPRDLDSPLRPIIAANFREQQQMFSTIRRPCREKPMLNQRQWPAAMNRDKSHITHL